MRALHDVHNVIPKRRSGGRGSTPTQGGSTLRDLIPRETIKKMISKLTMAMMTMPHDATFGLLSQYKKFTIRKKTLAGRSQSVTPIYKYIYGHFPDEG